jgi:uncharacterized protein (DUF1330 family)
MAKGYWIAFYRSITDKDALAAYAQLATPAVTAAGGKFLARGVAAHAFEAGVRERTVLIEFPSVEAAKACHDSEAYQAALNALGDGAERDFRLVEGVE